MGFQPEFRPATFVGDRSEGISWMYSDDDFQSLYDAAGDPSNNDSTLDHYNELSDSTFGDPYGDSVSPHDPITDTSPAMDSCPDSHDFPADQSTDEWPTATESPTTTSITSDISLDINGQHSTLQANLDLDGDGINDAVKVDAGGGEFLQVMDTDGDHRADRAILTSSDGTVIGTSYVDPATGQWVDVAPTQVATVSVNSPDSTDDPLAPISTDSGEKDGRWS